MQRNKALLKKKAAKTQTKVLKNANPSTSPTPLTRPPTTPPSSHVIISKKEEGGIKLDLGSSSPRTDRDREKNKLSAMSNPNSRKKNRTSPARKKVDFPHGVDASPQKRPRSSSVDDDAITMQLRLDGDSHVPASVPQETNDPPRSAPPAKEKKTPSLKRPRPVSSKAKTKAKAKLPSKTRRTMSDIDVSSTRRSSRLRRAIISSGSVAKAMLEAEKEAEKAALAEAGLVAIPPRPKAKAAPKPKGAKGAKKGKKGNPEDNPEPSALTSAPAVPRLPTLVLSKPTSQSTVELIPHPFPRTAFFLSSFLRFHVVGEAPAGNTRARRNLFSEASPDWPAVKEIEHRDHLQHVSDCISLFFLFLPSLSPFSLNHRTHSTAKKRVFSIAEFLDVSDLSFLSNLFEQHEIQFETLPYLNELDMVKDLGLKKLGPRKRLVRALKEYEFVKGLK